jgi:hypothetical protein
LAQEHREHVPCYCLADKVDAEVEEELHERLTPREHPLVAEAPRSGTVWERRQ